MAVDRWMDVSCLLIQESRILSYKFFAQDGTKYLLLGDKSAGLVKLAK